MSQIPQLKKLNNTESLFIRATLRPNALAMVRHVYRRHYLGYSSRDADFHIVGIMLKICQDFIPLDPIRVIDGLNPAYHGFDQHGFIDGYYTKVLKLIISHIRLTQRVDDLPGFRTPLWIRNMRDV